MKTKTLLNSAGLAVATRERWQRANYRYHRLHFPISGAAIYHDVNGDKLLEVGNLYLLVNSTAPNFELLEDEQYYHMYLDFRTVPPLLNRDVLCIALGEDPYLTYLLKALRSLLQAQENQKLGKGMTSQKPGEELFHQAQSLLHVILSHLCSKYGLQAMENPKVEHAIRYIEKNYANHISNSDVAEELHIDTRYFMRLFKKYVGMSPYQYLTQCRIEHAIDELRNDRSVTETAQLCGYQNENAFRIAFKRVMGCSPTSFFK